MRAQRIEVAGFDSRRLHQYVVRTGWLAVSPVCTGSLLRGALWLRHDLRHVVDHGLGRSLLDARYRQGPFSRAMWWKKKILCYAANPSFHKLATAALAAGRAKGESAARRGGGLRLPWQQATGLRADAGRGLSSPLMEVSCHHRCESRDTSWAA